jgi:outer membrane protein TolC
MKRKMKKSNLALLLCCFLSILLVKSQEKPVFGFDQFRKQILAYHPVAKQINLINDEAKANLTMNRGFFDPTLSADYDTKLLNDKLYYENWSSYLKIPIYNFIDIKAGWERNIGQFVNPEYKTSDPGLMVLGASFPLGRGLFTDIRQNQLNQAKVMIKIAEAERVKMVNKLMLEAAKDYFDWYQQYYEFEIISKAYDLALERFLATKQRAKFGDVADIDTVETKMLVQQREIEKVETGIALMQAQLKISTYLWDENLNALTLTPGVIPDLNYINPVQIKDLNDWIEFALTKNPELLKLKYKLEMLSIERRLALENLKPEINLNYNFINSSNFTGNENIGAGFRNNYKWGINAYMPIFLRKERGKLATVNIKNYSTKLEFDFTRQMIENNVRQAFFQYENFKIICKHQEDINASLKQLRDAEIINFNNGESSIFLINSRDNKFVEGQIKLIKLQSKVHVSLAKLIYETGVELVF